MKYFNEKRKSTTYVDSLGSEYQAAAYVADINDDLTKDNRDDVTAICITTEVDRRYVDKLRTYNENSKFEYTIYAEVEYDYVHNEIIKDYTGVKYVKKRPAQYIMNGIKGTMTCFIPFQYNMEGALLSNAKKMYGYYQNKIKANKNAKKQ